ncbi:hypothetical protein PRIPAC_98028, partial [Pristionchus pacificus]|uniref:Uncharacterized protein n=1 Tax=Pristionchus pacificus TaxID=54126 RepID=A0A2A6CU05_PRIPA
VHPSFMSLISIVLLSLLAIQSSHAMINLRVARSAGMTLSTCHRSVITERCSLTGDFAACVHSSCSDCIIQSRTQSAFNGFDMHCIRLTACVCSIINDASCYAMTAECH